jgi:uncharacterized protein involved in exopolysaccharide biosynthesis
MAHDIIMTPRQTSGTAMLLASLRHDRAWIVLGVVITLAIAGFAAFAVKPAYQARSTLLVMLGSEYTYRTVPGQQANMAGALNRDQILRTEIEILEEDDLHRIVIGAIGATTLYPELIAPPGLLSRASTLVKGVLVPLGESLGIPEPAQSEPRAVDSVEMALARLDSHLNYQAIKDGNGIELTFSHEDPVMAARVLQLLEQNYLLRRRELYLTEQGQAVNTEVEVIRKNLKAADDRLLDYKRLTRVDDYQARRAILQNQQGALETELRTARDQADQNAARIAQLDQQIHSLPGAYQSLVNPLMLQMQQERNKALIELQTNKTQVARDLTHLGEVSAGLQDITTQERQIDQLTRDRDMLAEAFKAADKVRNETTIAERVENSGRENVRVLQVPRVPVVPASSRKLILLAGAVLSALVGAAIALILHATRRVYLLPEAVERDVNLRVILTVPESGTLATTTMRLLEGPSANWGAGA